ncbi:MAG TPA: aldehyde dehydrogenase family protein [Acidimicrobiia bacterium]|nr:aldehyde dehydrogenase family protein [Acidimicrobiia bacterium]
MSERLERLEAGMVIPYGGDRVTRVPEDLAAEFSTGDRLVVVQEDGTLLHIPAAVGNIADAAVDRAVDAFERMGSMSQQAITEFFQHFAAALGDDTAFSPIAEANRADVARARERGRSTTRLELTDRMRSDMVDSLRIWERTRTSDEPVERVDHEGWRVEIVRAGLGVVGFVFEGRPNVFADATGVLRSGNTVVFRIGSDALGTARAIMQHAVEPALKRAGLPAGAVTLVDSPARAAGWAMFSDPRLGLAVARGSGPAVAQLGAVARQAGTAVSLHGTGGAWLVVATDADLATTEQVVYHSLDRKVCNTLNTVVVVGEEPQARVAAVLAGLQRAAERRGTNPKLHVAGDVELSPWWTQEAEITRAEGPVTELLAESLPETELGREWEWEASPEITLTAAPTLEEAAESFNRHSPRFVTSLVSEDPEAHDRFFALVDAPFVGNGFTRWVDGQYALQRPELGLSNWQFGRLFGRGGVLSGDSIYTLRTRAIQDDPDIGR